MDEDSLQAFFLEKDIEHEDVCKRCGSCCGLMNDPCSLLSSLPDGSYHCKDYKNRIGLKTTISGKSFHCVPIRDLITQKATPHGCSYGA